MWFIDHKGNDYKAINLSKTTLNEKTVTFFADWNDVVVLRFMIIPLKYTRTFSIS